MLLSRSILSLPLCTSPLHIPSLSLKVAMKQLILILLLLTSAIAADAQLVIPSASAETASRDIVERPRFFDNWSMTLAGGAYHSNVFALKYLVDCSALAGNIELRKQLTPIIGLGIDADGYYRMTYKERKDPRTVIGPVLHVNLMNLFGGYNGRPRLFEIEALVKPAWGHLYRGVADSRIPDENYFATKYGLDLNFNVGRERQWTLVLRPAINLDVTSVPPVPGYMISHYDGYKWSKTDLLLFVGATYHFRGHGGKHHFRFAKPETNIEEVERLNEVVRFLRDDVESRDRQIRELKLQIDSLKH